MASNNNVPTDFDLKDLLNLTIREVMLTMNCHAIGQIQSFQSSPHQTADITINYKKLINGIKVPYPVLTSCPMIILGGANGTLTFPIRPGDDCIVFFNDRDLDRWFAGNIQLEPNTSRLHSFSDAIAFIGPRSQLNPVSNYDNDRVVLQNSQLMSALKLGQKIQIQNQVSDLATVLKGLINEIKNLMTVPVVNGSPAAIGPASQASLEAYKAQVEALLGDS